MSPPQLDEAFLYDQTIDIDTYDRQRDKLREARTLAQMDRHASELEELDIEGILRWQTAFAERVEPMGAGVARSEAATAAAVFFYGLAFDGNRFVGTWVRLPIFNYFNG